MQVSQAHRFAALRIGCGLGRRSSGFRICWSAAVRIDIIHICAQHSSLAVKQIVRYDLHPGNRSGLDVISRPRGRMHTDYSLTRAI